jgi:uncharacterized membrane protein YtjA (UPF0391 family)
VAIVAGAFGFGRISEAATGIAKILFLIFIVLFAINLIFCLLGSGSSPV